MPDQARWPTWTPGRIVGTIAMILLGLIGAFVGSVVFFFLSWDSDSYPVGASNTIVDGLIGALLIGLPASIPFFIVSRRRRKPFWSWLAVMVCFTTGGLVALSAFG